MAITEHTGIPRPLNVGCIKKVHISVSNNPFCLGSSVTFTPTITCLETAQIASYAWILNGNIVSTSGDPYTTTELTNNDSVYLLVIGTNGVSYFSNVIYMVVTSDGCITEIKYGLLYNWYAATDVRNITSEGDFVVPSNSQWLTLVDYLGGAETSGKKLKEIGYIYWNYDPEDTYNGTNEFNFNGRGSSYRFVFDEEEEEIIVGFDTIKNSCVFATTDTYYGMWLRVSLNAFSDMVDISDDNAYTSLDKRSGFSIRLVRPATEAELLLADGTACTPYIGNDGKSYPTVKIGTQVWLAANLAETKFRNGDYLHGYEGGSYQAISDANWSALVSEGVCCYNNDINLI